MVKNLPAMQETQVPSLGWEDPVEKEMATHSSIAWEIPWTEEPGSPRDHSPQGCKEWTGLKHLEADMRTHTQARTLSLYPFLCCLGLAL